MILREPPELKYKLNEVLKQIERLKVMAGLDEDQNERQRLAEEELIAKMKHYNVGRYKKG